MNQDENKEYFHLLKNFWPPMELISQAMKYIFEEHLAQLITCFEKYFQNDSIDKFAWISKSAFLKINFYTGSFGKIWI